MAKKTTEKRRLIKFSNYSMCITLPKWVVDQLEWKKGDELTLVTDVKHGKITLYKEELEENGGKKSQENQQSDEIKPIPKLRW